MDENKILCEHGERKMNPNHWENPMVDAEHSRSLSQEGEDIAAHYFSI